MLEKSEAFSSYSVDDIAAAKRFYGETLGLEVEEQPEGLGLKLATGGAVFLYPKDNHEPAGFTVLNFPVVDIEGEVDSLARSGVAFERYEGFDQDERGIAHPPPGPGKGPPIAWFKDPAGNILSILKG